MRIKPIEGNLGMDLRDHSGGQWNQY